MSLERCVLCGHLEKVYANAGNRHRCPGRITPYPDYFYWHLSDDQRTLTLLFIEHEGERKIQLGWDHRVTDAELRFALETANDTRSLGVSRNGQENTHWRFRTRVGTVYVGLMTGPPTWWIPKVSLKRGHAMVGWLQRAVSLSFRREHS